MGKLVSVIIPVYNTAEAVVPLAEALLQGNYRDIELICVDDGSSDKSYERLSELAKNDKRMIVKRQKNAGASSARNRGLALAKGEYVCFVDSDDMVSEKYVEKLVEAIEKERTVLALCQIKQRFLAMEKEAIQYKNALTRKEHESFRNYIMRSLLVDGRMYPVVNKIFRRRVIEENSLCFDTQRDFAEDVQFVLRYLDVAGEGEVAFVGEPLYTYNYGGETSTVARSALAWKNWERSLEDVKKFCGEDSGAKKQLKKLKLRWQISHGLAVVRAPIHSSEKRKILNPVSLAIFSLLQKIRH